VRRRYALVPLAMVIVLVVHFAPYSWLYATPLYLVMGAAVAVGVTVMMSLGVRAARVPGAPVPDEQTAERRSAIQAGRASLVTGLVLGVSAVVAWFL
jgi:hypothetical protein